MLQLKLLFSSVNLKLLDKPTTAFLPNLITGTRVLATPVIIYLILTNSLKFSFILFFFAGLTDWADGFFARRYSLESNFGRLFDPLADKILLVGVYLTLFYMHFVPWWLSLAVVARDFLIISGSCFVWYCKLPMKVEPLFISKVNTLLQILLCLFVLASPFSSSFFFRGFLVVLIYATLISTVLSGYAYAKLFYQSHKK
jgi:cardiolipin synthase